MQEIKNYITKIKSNPVEFLAIIDSTTLEMIADIKNRMVVDGLPIEYSKDPIYVSKDMVLKGSFKSQGKKNKSSKLKNGNDRKTMYLEEGYYQLRKITNHFTNKMNFEFTGDMTRALIAERKNLVVEIGFNNDIEMKKYEGNLDRFGEKGFSLVASDDDLKTQLERINEQLNQL